MNNLEILASNNDRCGECPIWDTQSQRLIWNDMNASRVFTFDHATKVIQALNTNGLNAAGMAFNESGELVFAGTGGLHLWHELPLPVGEGKGEGEYHTLLTHHNDEYLNFNDILADPKGRL